MAGGRAMAPTPPWFLGGDKGVRKLGKRDLCAACLALVLYQVLAAHDGPSIIVCEFTSLG